MFEVPAIISSSTHAGTGWHRVLCNKYLWSWKAQALEWTRLSG